MFASLHTIEAACAPLAPGLRTIQVVDPNDLVVQPSWWLLPAFEALQYKPGRGAFPLKHTILSGKITERALESAAGDVFEVTLSAAIRNVRAEVDYLRAKMRNRRFHVLAFYSNGLQRYVPNMKFSTTSDSGDRSSQNGYTFQATARLWRPAPVVAALSPVMPGSVIPPVVNPTVEGGVTVTQISVSSSIYTFTIPAGKLLLCVYAKSSAGQTVQIGTTAGDWNLSGPLEMTANTWALLGDNLWHADTATPIYISGLAGTNTLKFYIL